MEDFVYIKTKLDKALGVFRKAAAKLEDVLNDIIVQRDLAEEQRIKAADAVTYLDVEKGKVERRLTKFKEFLAEE